MKKERVYIPGKSGVFEQAEHLADMEGKKKGFRRGSLKWKAAKQKYLIDRYKHSSIPHMSNPTPQYVHDAANTFKVILERNKFNRKKDFKKYDEVIKGAVTTISHTYLELILNKKVKGRNGASDFEITEGMSKAQKEQVIMNQYLRYFVIASVYGSLEPLFKSTKGEFEGAFRAFVSTSGMEGKNIKQLNNKATRVKFVLSVISGIQKLIGPQSLFQRVVQLFRAA